MVSKEGVVVLDSNLFIIDLRYPRDRHYRINRAFFARLPAIAPAATTLVNLLEVCGILSFSLSAQEVWELYHYLPKHYGITVLPPAALPVALPGSPVERLMTLMAKKLSFGDALVLDAIESWIPQASCFVSWDAQHFRGKTSLPVLTPPEFLKEIEQAKSK